MVHFINIYAQNFIDRAVIKKGLETVFLDDH